MSNCNNISVENHKLDVKLKVFYPEFQDGHHCFAQQRLLTWCIDESKLHQYLMTKHILIKEEKMFRGKWLKIMGHLTTHVWNRNHEYALGLMT